jgi:hypothetical protein
MFLQYAILAAVLILPSHPFQGNTTDDVIKDFNNRVGRYWDIHKKAESAAPEIDKKKEDPSAILQHETALAAAIRAARMNAAEGDIFTAPVQKVFLGLIAQELSSGSRGKTAREIILGEGNPKHPDDEGDSKHPEKPARVVLAVNAKYPSAAPLSTVPPSVLLKLPKLPEGLQYRFVGRHLILLDSKANLIVDILRNAIR